MKSLALEAKGVEPNLGYAQYMKQELDLDIQVGFIQDMDFPEGSFDVATLWHVLEHTESPSTVLRRLGSLLSDKGSLIVEVPNIKAVCQSPRGTFHVAHLYNFSIDTLSSLMVKSGLVPKKSLLSPDGGNLTVIAGKGSLGESPEALAHDGPREAEEVKSLILGRTTARYLLTPWPYRRAWGRLSQAVGERLHLGVLKNEPGVRRGILDRLYRDVAAKS
jgi:SAM-dependent methyltransferase